MVKAAILPKVEVEEPVANCHDSEDSFDFPLQEKKSEFDKEEWIDWDKLIKENQKLVYSLAWKHMGQGIELSDLIQIGNLGLIKAAGKFDPTRGVLFSSYAFYWIQQTIMLALKNQSRIIRIPTHIIEQIKRYYQAQERLYHTLGREPMSAEIAESLYSFEEESKNDLKELKAGKISLDDMLAREDEREKRRRYFREIQEVLQVAQVPLSLDEPHGENEDYNFYESVPDREMETPEESFIKKNNEMEVRWLLGYLSEREKYIIYLRFGFGGDEPFSFQEIAEKIGITKQGVRKILIKALGKLKRLREHNMSA